MGAVAHAAGLDHDPFKGAADAAGFAAGKAGLQNNQYPLEAANGDPKVVDFGSAGRFNYARDLGGHAMEEAIGLFGGKLSGRQSDTRSLLPSYVGLAAGV